MLRNNFGGKRNSQEGNSMCRVLVDQTVKGREVSWDNTE